MTTKEYQFPILVEQDEDGKYVAECPTFSGCYTEGNSLDEALKNINEVIALCLEEEENKIRLQDYHPRSFSFHLCSSKINV